MKRWNLKATYDAVKVAFGEEQERLAHDSIRSVIDRQDFARYHFQETVRLTRSFERKYLGKSLLIDLHSQDSQRKRFAFEKYIAKAGAHATAAIQSVHAIPDILAHAMYFASAQNLGPNAVDNDAIAVPSVVRVLRLDTRFARLAPLLESAQSGEGWRHLAAISNASKHRSVVRASLSEDWTGTRKNFRELHVKSFERKGRIFPAASLQSILESEYSRLSLLTLTIGHELDACLRTRAA